MRCRPVFDSSESISSTLLPLLFNPPASSLETVVFPLPPLPQIAIFCIS
jgi:hypothetical protein